MSKAAAIYQLAKDLPLNQLVTLQELLGGAIQAAMFPNIEEENEELAIEKRLIRNRVLVLPKRK